MRIRIRSRDRLQNTDSGSQPKSLQARCLLALIAAAFMAACGGSDSGDDSSAPTDNNPVASNLQCESISAEVTSAPPLSRVSLSGLSGAQADTAWVSAETAGGAAYPTALYVDEAGEAELLVPLHPDGRAGGALTLTVTDGNARCPGIAFQVMPLPVPTGDPAGELDAALESVATALAGRLGTARATLDAAPLDQLSPELAALALLFESLDAVDLASELAALEPDARADLQALLASIDLSTPLQALSTRIDALPLPALGDASIAGSTEAAPTGALSPLRRAMEPARMVRQRLAPQATPADCVDLGSVDPNRFDLDSPEVLADYLETARGAADLVGPLRDGINDLNTAFTVLGLVPGGGWTTAGISVVWGWFSYTIDLANQLRANLYPSAITRLDYSLTETRIPEDWDTTRDGDLRWFTARLFATNNGMNITRAIVDGSLNTVSSAFAGAGAARGLLTEAQALGLGAVDVAGRSAIDNRLDELEPDDSRVVECWNISATEFGPVLVPDSTADQWVRGRIVSGDALSVSDRDLTPLRIGAATLRVETNTDNLPGPRGFLERSIEVARKSVVWIPGNLFVNEAGNRETVRMRIDDARHADPEDIQFLPDPDLFIPIEIPVGSNVYEVSFTTPEDPGAYPLEYTATSISAELPPAQPPRSATLTIFARENITISPRRGCVASGDARDLAALVSSVDTSPNVEWQVVAGQGRLIVGGSGLQAAYIAPDAGSGQATIRAVLEQPAGATGEPTQDEITLSYGNCAPLAVFYEFDASYDLPGVLSGCSAPGSPGEQFEVRNDNAENDGKNPEIPLTPIDFDGPGQVVNINEALGSTGVRGNGTPDRCAAGTFPTDFRNQSSLTVTDAGDTLAYDIDLTANGTCGSFSDGAAACSSAEAFSGVWLRYALPVEAATTFQLDLNLACTDNSNASVPTTLIQLFFLRTDVNGSPRPNHADPLQFIGPTRSLSCGELPQTITFAVDDPLTPGTTDTMTVMVVTATGIGTATEPGAGQERLNATLSGTVSARQVAP